jgi:hypothetical protein
LVAPSFAAQRVDKYRDLFRMCSSSFSFADIIKLSNVPYINVHRELLVQTSIVAHVAATSKISHSVWLSKTSVRVTTRFAGRTTKACSNAFAVLMVHPRFATWTFHATFARARL